MRTAKFQMEVSLCCEEVGRCRRAGSNALNTVSDQIVKITNHILGFLKEALYRVRGNVEP